MLYCCCSFFCYLSIVLELLFSGAQVNIANNFGMIALHYAAQTLNEFMIKKLLNHNANRLSLDHQKRLPYHVAVQWGSSPNILQILEPDDFEIREMGLPSTRSCPWTLLFCVTVFLVQLINLAWPLLTFVVLFECLFSLI